MNDEVGDVAHVTTDALRFLYPKAGDAKPPLGAKVALLTVGGVCIVGPWDDSFVGWAPLPKRDRTKEAMLNSRWVGATPLQPRTKCA